MMKLEADLVPEDNAFLKAARVELVNHMMLLNIFDIIMDNIIIFISYEWMDVKLNVYIPCFMEQPLAAL